MIPQKMAALELAKVEADISKWEQRVAIQHKRLCTVAFYGLVDRDLAEQILATFKAALASAYVRRDRLLDHEAITFIAPQQNSPPAGPSPH